MSSKEQKFNKYDDAINEEVSNKYLNGVSSWYLEREYGASYNTIKSWGIPKDQIQSCY